MKKGFIICAIVGSLLTACSESETKQEDTPATMEQTTTTVPVTNTISTDSTKAAAAKRIKDSTDKAHGHSHD